MFALSHVLLLMPQNPFHTLQFAETAYTAGDVPLATMMFVQVVYMTHGTDGSEPLAESTPEGITVRAWYGVKLVCPHIQPLAQFTNRRWLPSLSL